jgi:hypothetical protein
MREWEFESMDLQNEIVARLGQLPPEMQEEVLRFVVSLTTPAAKGERGAMLRSFAGSLDPVSAREMIEAVQQECERVDACEW